MYESNSTNQEPLLLVLAPHKNANPLSVRVPAQQSHKEQNHTPLIVCAFAAAMPQPALARDRQAPVADVNRLRNMTSSGHHYDQRQAIRSYNTTCLKFS